MTKTEKKELFLLIIENVFEDKSEDLNQDNCIGFYNFFLDCLDFECKFSPEYESGYHKFLLIIIRIFSDFPTYSKSSIESKCGLKNIISSFSEEVHCEKFDIFFIYMTSLFFTSKNEYLI